MRDEVDFLHSDKHESLLQIDNKFFDGYGQAFPKFPKKQVCNVFTISLKKLDMKLTFLMQINIKVSSQFISTLWASKFSTLLYKVFYYCDAKYLDNLLGSSHVCCYLFLGYSGQKWVWSFRSWNSKICCMLKKVNWKMI